MVVGMTVPMLWLVPVMFLRTSCCGGAPSLVTKAMATFSRTRSSPLDQLMNIH